MKDEVAIKVHDLHKSFDKADSKRTSIKQLFVNLGKKNKKSRQKVLDGIDFEIKKGEFFGIVGRNGSGKSTLLKLLAGVYTPDKGSIQINGNLTPFIELGVGFNSELSGRDNVYLSASLLGFTRKQVDEIYDDIVSFAELEEHMEKKLKNYSSGMQVRLAFSIAVKAKNDILIFDEVLAVGDEAFQQKCLRIFEEYREKTQTVVLVTHDMNSVRTLCTRAMLIDNGKIKHIGTVEGVADLYSGLNINGNQNIMPTNTKKRSTAKIQIKSKNNKKIYMPHESLELEILLKAPPSDNNYMGVAIFDNSDTYVFGSNTKGLRINSPKIRHTISLDLGPGKYTLSAAILSNNGKIIEYYEKVFGFTIIDDENPNVGGGARLKYDYEAN